MKKNFDIRTFFKGITIASFAMNSYNLYSKHYNKDDFTDQYDLISKNNDDSNNLLNSSIDKLKELIDFFNSKPSNPSGPGGGSLSNLSINEYLPDSFISWSNGVEIHSYLIEWGDLTIYFVKYNEFLSGLTLDQKLCVMNISAALFIFITLFSIVSTIFGNYLIDYITVRTKLGEKFPFLNRYLNLRKKFTLYFMGIDLFLISIVLIVEILFNLLYLSIHFSP